MKKFLISLSALILGFSSTVRADEGMWLLPYLEQFNAKSMAEIGCELTPDQIFSMTNPSIKDAIVIFGRGCTGEIVSKDGLLFTNHHCGFESIQQLSSVEHDYLRDGFWAMNRDEELPVQGLTVTFIKKFVDITDEYNKALPESLEGKKRAKAYDKFFKKYEKAELKEDPYVSCNIVPFYEGNKRFLIVMKEYKDIRLVGTPPSSIGKFGGDTDNWMWPRHTGDFSIFRVYADENNQPAEYAPTNRPIQAPNHLTVSTKGYEEGDFTMIMGFPGSTNRYMTSVEIAERRDVSNAIRIDARGIRQEILMNDMLADQATYIKYASKYAMSSNYWKNSIGMNQANDRLGVEQKQKAIEDQFQAWVNADPARIEKYGKVVEDIYAIIGERTSATGNLMYISESVNSCEILHTAGMIGQFQKMEELTGAKQSILDFYDDINIETDKKVTKAMLAFLRDHVESLKGKYIFEIIDTQYNGDIDEFVDKTFEKTLFASAEKLFKFTEGMSDNDMKNIFRDDEAVKAGRALTAMFLDYRNAASQYSQRLAKARKTYMAGLMEMNGDNPIYPDANFTMRLTYGQVLPYSPKDAVVYKHYTTLKGIMEKENPESHEFTVPARLKEIYNTQDFGPYAMENGEMPVAFLSNNDITGGNSGSPIMNSKGELIGLAFDGNWEAMSGDLIFEPVYQRCINLDVRYLLLIIDKFGGAGYLLDEMTIK